MNKLINIDCPECGYTQVVIRKTEGPDERIKVYDGDNLPPSIIKFSSKNHTCAKCGVELLVVPKIHLDIRTRSKNE